MGIERDYFTGENDGQPKGDYERSPLPNGFSESNIDREFENPGTGRILVKDGNYFFNEWDKASDDYSIEDPFPMEKIGEETEYTQEMEDSLVCTFTVPQFDLSVGKNKDGTYFSVSTRYWSNDKGGISEFKRGLGVNNWKRSI